MSQHTLRIGRIAYLNVWPLFTLLAPHLENDPRVTCVSGHPSELNAALRRGDIDVAPASAFAYLRDPDGFRLLPDLSIAAAVAPIQSVLLVSPVPVDGLADYLRRTGDTVLLSRASASSNALLRVLWRHHWKLPEPRFEMIAPGTGLATDRPFVEIGDTALAHYLRPPEGRQVIDLGQAWFDFTGMPFVFATWIVRDGLDEARATTLGGLWRELARIKGELPRLLEGLVDSGGRPPWIAAGDLAAYLRGVSYDLGPVGQASLLLFGHHCRELGLIPAVPGLRWQEV
ncbi:menaquinone biosynthetic enzyme MqnA/MqnD family protein [Desulfolutivibrio sulfoxidireducens]|uniref:menaquinone biosynthetic enzyme MqnA/MqnD family protein n=1 Tax=Desulfolutivibrio sulfoxidireducens TaxID=2773299 RepID=UPI00159D4776|nr:menaquinone biosynthesis protein [Desulfolutivibrio sulfoxidireducens]QLA16187.1 solute-binding protein [Desulfolutivibrio sulfoxidireducens]QLA19915.1 solute-binding protein [Desulfolutivibrio sulfoxidireducens]